MRTNGRGLDGVEQVKVYAIVDVPRFEQLIVVHSGSTPFTYSVRTTCGSGWAIRSKTSFRQGTCAPRCAGAQVRYLNGSCEEGSPANAGGSDRSKAKAVSAPRNSLPSSCAVLPNMKPQYQRTRTTMLLTVSALPVARCKSAIALFRSV